MAIRTNVLDSIGNTSMLALRNVVPGNGTRILLKLESENPTGSMKDRMALAMIEAAEGLPSRIPGTALDDCHGHVRHGMKYLKTFGAELETRSGLSEPREV